MVAAQYRERVVGPYRALLPAAAVASIEEELSGSCTVEVAAFNEFVTLLTSDDVAHAYDHVIFDTAPTGHTLRLLALRDADRTTVVLVARTEHASLAEAARASHERAHLGMTSQRLVLNGVLADPAQDDPVAQARHLREAAAIEALPDALERAVSIDTVPLFARAPLGVDALRASLAGAPATAASPTVAMPDLDALSDLVDELAQCQQCVVMTMGKGGVGKTTIAAALALALADRGLPVTFTTTDPAAHVRDVLPDPPINLRVTRIDPAPTGHTLLLLESSQSFASQSAASGKSTDDAATSLFATLSDPAHTRIILVALPEATPVHEGRWLSEIADASRRRAAVVPWLPDVPARADALRRLTG